MVNLAPFNYSDLRHCFGQSIAHLADNTSCVGVSTDTRTLAAGNIFIAIKGESFNGHDHVQSAIEKGASLCIVEDAAIQGPAIVCVASTVHALATLAWFHRKRFTFPVIAIAGSAGKTSTKELVAHVLREQFSVLQTQANYNNQIGTPLTLLQLDASHTAAVIEIGTNEPGEIELLSAMVQPTHGLITQIGKEHLEKLIDLDGVEKEETTLFEFLNDHDGVLLVNNDDERLRAWYTNHGGRGLTFGVDAPADLQAQLTFDAELHPIVHVVLPDGGMRAKLFTTGVAAGLNAVAAFAVAKAVGMDVRLIKQGLQSYKPAETHGYARLAVQRIRDLIILNDTYNANPESMLMALRTLAAYPAVNRIAVLGDMRELGTAAQAEHQNILTSAVSLANVVIVHGNDFAHASIQHPSVHVCRTHRECATIIQTLGKPGTAVLVKGSRGMMMENVIAELGDH